jgi:hypothetical protein
MRAYVALEQQRNVLRMKPTPKPMDVSDLQRQRQRAREAKANGQEPGWRGKRKLPDQPSNVVVVPAVSPAPSQPDAQQQHG